MKIYNIFNLVNQVVKSRDLLSPEGPSTSPTATGPIILQSAVQWGSWLSIVLSECLSTEQNARSMQLTEMAQRNNSVHFYQLYKIIGKSIYNHSMKKRRWKCKECVFQ